MLWVGWFDCCGRCGFVLVGLICLGDFVWCCCSWVLFVGVLLVCFWLVVLFGVDGWFVFGCLSCLFLVGVGGCLFLFLSVSWLVVVLSFQFVVLFITLKVGCGWCLWLVVCLVIGCVWGGVCFGLDLVLWFRWGGCCWVVELFLSVVGELGWCFSFGCFLIGCVCCFSFVLSVTLKFLVVWFWFVWVVLLLVFGVCV